ncbi:hypothetical protein [Burkholderia sp. BCC1630]|uniref:hypothetical protein n=1 Tax=Burkholderia sp. BCC1630 TaxID=2676304 RepID=UPI001FC7DB8F|nr:hypothetical protein [Burkholderia sp. BCC1630]
MFLVQWIVDCDKKIDITKCTTNLLWLAGALSAQAYEPTQFRMGRERILDLDPMLPIAP